MIEPKIPDNENKRIHALQAVHILDTPAEERFDRITRMAKRMFDVPISLVSIVDCGRQWFKSKQGLDAEETSREISFCGHAINDDDLFIVNNALEDERFHDNPLVTDAPNIRFYAGCPLKVSSGFRLGTLCIIDDQPREMTEEDCQLLRDLASMVEKEISAIQLATLDDLTKISNRRGFITLAKHMMKVARRKQMPMNVLLFDLDKFKPINDSYGHQEGDYVLNSFAAIIRSVFRESDIFARIGGDEFAVMLMDIHEHQIELMIHRFNEKLKELNESNGKPYQIEYSVGVESFDFDTADDIETLIDKADQAMYREKSRNA